MTGKELTIAVPTGAMLNDALALLDATGVAPVDPGGVGRRLVIPTAGATVLLVKPGDVPPYVDHGAADLGICGLDSIWESPGSYYQLVDLGIGPCRLVIAAPESSPICSPADFPPLLRVATKYPRATAAYLQRIGQAADIVQLKGSVELAPQVGLADVISDLTATGTTLRENRLRIVAEVAASTARLIANHASLRTRGEPLQRAISRLRQAGAASAG